MAGDVVVGVADEELVERVRRGDPQAFRVLVDRHRAWLTARCRRHLGGDAHAAEDVAQECLVALQRTVVGGDKPMRVRPWLSVVARNRCIDEARKLRAVPTASVPDAAVFDPETGAEDPHLARAWSALTGRHRTVLELREVGGLSYEEIAVTLAVTAGAVETLLFRARTALRREYARAGGKVAAMAPIEEAVAAASGHQGALSRLAEGTGAGIDGLSSMVGADSAAGTEGLSTATGAPGWLSDLQARLVTSPAFEPVVHTGAGSGIGGGRLRLVLAGLGMLLGTAVATVPTLDGAPADHPSPSAPTATSVPVVPAAPAPPSAPAPPAPPSSPTVDTDAADPPAAEAPAPPAEPPPATTPRPGAPSLEPLTRPVSPLLEGFGATVTTGVDAVDALGGAEVDTAPVAPLDGVVRRSGS